MKIENAFTVAAPPDKLWAHLLDVERIAPCMPGAELTETVDDTTWKGRVNMKFGPVLMSFAGSVQMTERDDGAHRVVLSAKGMEQKGKGAANATVTSWLEPGADPSETTVKMEADITLTGAAAQLSRGLLPEVSKKLTQQFADCLEAQMGAEAAAAGAGGAAAAAASAAALESTGAAPAGPPAPGPTPAARPPTAQPPAAEPVGGIRLGLSAVWSLVVNFFKRLFGGPAQK